MFTLYISLWNGVIHEMSFEEIASVMHMIFRMLLMFSM
jgi:hypothetical protein